MSTSGSQPPSQSVQGPSFLFGKDHPNYSSYMVFLEQWESMVDNAEPSYPAAVESSQAWTGSVAEIYRDWYVQLVAVIDEACALWDSRRTPSYTFPIPYKLLSKTAAAYIRQLHGCLAHGYKPAKLPKVGRGSKPSIRFQDYLPSDLTWITNEVGESDDSEERELDRTVTDPSTQFEGPLPVVTHMAITTPSVSLPNPQPQSTRPPPHPASKGTASSQSTVANSSIHISPQQSNNVSASLTHAPPRLSQLKTKYPNIPSVLINTKNEGFMKDIFDDPVRPVFSTPCSYCSSKEQRCLINPSSLSCIPCTIKHAKCVADQIAARREEAWGCYDGTTLPVPVWEQEPSVSLSKRPRELSPPPASKLEVLPPAKKKARNKATIDVSSVPKHVARGSSKPINVSNISLPSPSKVPFDPAEPSLLPSPTLPQLISLPPTSIPDFKPDDFAPEDHALLPLAVYKKALETYQLSRDSYVAAHQAFLCTEDVLNDLKTQLKQAISRTSKLPNVDDLTLSDHKDILGGPKSKGKGKQKGWASWE